MDNFKKIGKKIVDFLGVFIPNITFLVIFLTFMVTIVSRYFFKTPVTWSYEVSVLGYMWTMFFGVGKAMEADEHVVFGLVYDAVKPRTPVSYTHLDVYKRQLYIRTNFMIWNKI